MNCAICGFDNTADTRFCKKCGAALSAAAATPAAAAPAAQPSPAAARPAPPAATPPLARTLPASAPPPPPRTPAATSDAPRGTRTPVIPLVIIFVILGITTFGVYQALNLLTAGLGASMAEAPKMDGMKDLMKDMMTPPPDAGAGAGSQTMPPGGAVPVEPAKAEEPAKEPEKAPEPPPSSSTPMQAPVPSAPPPPPPKAKAAPTTPAPAPKAAPAAPPPPPPAQAPAKAAQNVIPAPATGGGGWAAPDRWAQLGDELARCGREDVFRKLGCELRVRARYCEGYWGTVPQCPQRPTSGQ